MSILLESPLFDIMLTYYGVIDSNCKQMKQNEEIGDKEVLDITMYVKAFKTCWFIIVWHVETFS